MKVELTGNRKGTDCVICDVVFKNGKAELNDSEVNANVYAKLLNRYYGVVKAGDKKHVNEKALQEEEHEKSKDKYIADSRAKALAASDTSDKPQHKDTTTPLTKPKTKRKVKK